MSRKKHAAHRKAKPDARQSSHARKQCEALAARLVAVGAELVAWDEAREQASELYRTQLVPLDLSVRHCLRELVMLLDRMHRSADLDNSERQVLSDILADMAFELLNGDEEGDEDDEEDGTHVDGVDPELAAIYERHQRSDADDAAAFRQLVSQVVGIDINDDVDLDSSEVEEVVRLVLEEEEISMARLDRAQAQMDQYEERQAASLAHRRKTLETLAAELTAGLNGADGIEEAARQERLQCVEAARAQGMLADLMALGFAFEQEGNIDHLSEKRVSEYKNVLKEWLQLCEQELVLGKSWILLQLDLEVPDARAVTLAPADLLHMMNTTIRALREERAEIERDLVELREPAMLKAWLRTANDR